MAKYKLTEDGVKNTKTYAFIPNDERNNDWREYQNWLKGLDVNGEDLGTGPNVPDAQFSPKELVELEEQELVRENEAKIQDEIRKIAINNLIVSGKLPVNYK